MVVTRALTQRLKQSEARCWWIACAEMAPLPRAPATGAPGSSPP
ncbi:MAG TPA: hypothetical protein VK464_18280 [Symbiobacteriaceae bacterium]|nr:hypothetical protein [Symbiobacteriaceae bacterium]